MAYIGTTPKDIRSFGKAKFDFTATQGQTAFTGSDDDGKTLGFTTGQITVYLNGILLDESDYTASGSNTVTLASAANAGDILSVVALQTDIPNSDYVPATGGTFSGAVVANDGLTINNDAATVLTVDRATSDGTLVDFKKDGVSRGQIKMHSDRLVVGSGDASLKFDNGTNNILPWNIGTDAAQDNTVDLGSTSARFNELFLGGTIKWLDSATIPVPTNTIGVAGNTTAGNSGLYWINLESKGGTHVVLNTDGTRTTSRNVEDHFTIWQKANNQTDGRLAFSVDNGGNAVFGAAGVKIDRGWSNYPSITVVRNSHNGDDNTVYNEFRIHGEASNADTWWGGAIGADFAVNLRIDGATYITSDRRKKIQIESLTSALDAVMQLDGKRFKVINSDGAPQANMSKSGFKMGFIAQDIEDIIPDAVKHYPDEDDGTEGYNNAYSVDYASIVALLTNAIKEQQATIQALEARISALEPNQ